MNKVRGLLVVVFAVVLIIPAFAQESIPDLLTFEGDNIASVEQFPSTVQMVGGGNARVVVQDVMGRPGYNSFNKRLSTFETVDVGNDREGLVLFNLDIYTYPEEESDPGPTINQRRPFNSSSMGGHSIRYKINRARLATLLNRKLGGAKHWQDVEIYFMDPPSGAEPGVWRSIWELNNREIIIQENGANLFITVLEWPVDDRIHIGW